jgi:hypothetical protein
LSKYHKDFQVKVRRILTHPATRRQVQRLRAKGGTAIARLFDCRQLSDELRPTFCEGGVMRLWVLVLLAFTVALGVWFNAPGLTAGPVSASVSAAQDKPIPDINIDINKGGDGGNWYANPVFIGLGVLALVLIIALIVMAGRGGGTTVVKG